MDPFVFKAEMTFLRDKIRFKYFRTKVRYYLNTTENIKLT